MRDTETTAENLDGPTDDAVRRQLAEPNQNNSARCGQPGSKGQLAEILIVSKEDTVFRPGSRKDDLVAAAWHVSPCPDQVVSCPAEGFDGEAWNILVVFSTAPQSSTQSTASSSTTSSQTKPSNTNGLSVLGVDQLFSSTSGTQHTRRTLAGALGHGHSDDDWLTGPF